MRFRESSVMGIAQNIARLAVFFKRDQIFARHQPNSVHVSHEPCVRFAFEHVSHEPRSPAIFVCKSCFAIGWNIECFKHQSTECRRRPVHSFTHGRSSFFGPMACRGTSIMAPWWHSKAISTNGQKLVFQLVGLLIAKCIKSNGARYNLMKLPIH